MALNIVMLLCKHHCHPSLENFHLPSWNSYQLDSRSFVPLLIPWYSPFYFLSLWKKKWKWKSLSRVWLFATLWTIAYQAPLSKGFSRPEYWSGLPCPPPGDLPNPGIEPRSPTLQADSLPAEPQWKPKNTGSLSLLQWMFPIQELNQVSCTAGGFFTNWANREAQGYSEYIILIT